MALLKVIKQNNGVVLTYHRISNIRNSVNDKTYLNVISYIDKEEREKEKDQTIHYSDINETYKANETYSLPYNDTLTIEDAYDYLKTLEKFKGAEDC